MKRPAIMVDIETMDIEPTAAIVSIGAVHFDVAGQDTQESLIEHSFNVNISLESNEKLGRTMSASTIEWWLKQSKDAQKSLFEDPLMPLNTAMLKYRKWLESKNADRIYANDPDFDLVILNSAFKTINDRSPFAYHQHRSVRTAIEDAFPDDPMPNVETGTRHSARDDAIKQAIMVQHCWNKLHGN